MDRHVVTWALTVLVVLIFLRMAEGYVMTRPTPTPMLGVPSNVQDTMTGDKKYIYM
jgi:hypothetical protein